MGSTTSAPATIIVSTTAPPTPTSPTPTPTSTTSPTPTPTSTTSPTPAPTPTPTSTPPKVIAVAGLSSRKGLTAFTITYNEPVTGSATSTLLYHVFEGVKKVVKKHKETVFTKLLGITSVSPGSGPNAVTINLAKPFKGLVEVAVQGTVTAQNGASSAIDSAMEVP